MPTNPPVKSEYAPAETTREPVRAPEPPKVTWQQFQELDDNDRRRVATFVLILQRRSLGTSAPAENFILGLLREYWHYGPFTPQDAFDAVEQFRQDFDIAVGISEEFIGLYPEVMRKRIDDIYHRTTTEGGK